MNKKQTIAILSALSAVLMSIPFLVPHCGWVMLFAIVPFLCADKIARESQIKSFWWISYLVFLCWNAFTTWWVCNATVGGGIFASVANALQMYAIYALYRLSWKKFKGSLPYLFLVVMWIAWERFYFDAEISWPWLVLGNAFARSLRIIQWYEYTGALGGSLWVWATNMTIFGTMCVLGDGRFFEKWNSKARAALCVWSVAVFALPMIASLIIWSNNADEKISDEGTLEAMIVQPNFDPYQKFEFLSQGQQDEILINLVDSTFNESSDSVSPLVILAPETFTAGMVNGYYPTHKSWVRYLEMLKKHPQANFLYGASTYDYIASHSTPSWTARHAGDGLWLESHNSGIIMDSTGRSDVFHKSKLVVGTEYMPYPRVLGKLDDKLGGVIGRCIGQQEISTLDYMNPDQSVRIPLGCIVCYESIYGEYCTGYIKKGAKALCVITNDAWWGNTAGYVQHCSYSSLRAIETRREIARCANTGISCFINRRGEITSKLGWWERGTLNGSVRLYSGQTFFVSHGDIIGRVCTFIFLLLLLSIIVRFLARK